MGSIMKGIISFDLDMTLLDHKTMEIPESAMKAIEMLRDRFQIVVASGRDMDAAYSRRFRDQIQPDAIIHLNGTKITVGEQLIYNHNMDKKLLGRLLEYAEQKNYGLGVSIDDKDYYITPERIVENDMDFWGESHRDFQDPWALMDLGVRTLCYVGGEDGAKDIEEHFPELKLPMFAGKKGADVVEQQASKAEGLIRLCDYFNVDISNTAAFGDSMNDYEIIREAGIGIAMGNAFEELKKAADYVTSGVDNDGIWNACVHFGWI